MIELDELLTGTPTLEQVSEFWKNGEFYDERYLVQAIKKWLRTPEHRKLMEKMDLSIEEMLNGQYGSDKAPIVHQIYREWNTTLGFDSFNP